MSLITWYQLALLTIGFAFVFVGCGTSTTPTVSGDPPPLSHASDEVLPELGPHHGDLIDLGKGEYHAELTHDDATKTIIVYLLDQEAKESVPIADSEIVLNLVVEGKPLQVKLAAAAQSGDPQGQSSRFSVTDEQALEALEAPIRRAE
jgi:hypothetical protein